MPTRPCLGIDGVCPARRLVHGRRCPDCERKRNRARDAARGGTTARDYGAEHQRLRAQWSPTVSTGTVECWRCRTLIGATERWQLGHVDGTGRRWPEHWLCNERAGGLAAHDQQRA